jgi:hypothetical protein
MGNIDPARTATLMKWVMEFPLKYPDQITSRVHNLGGDSSWYLDTRKEVVCLRVDVLERGQSVFKYYVRETSEAWSQSEMQQLIGGLIKPAPPKG